MLCKTEQGEIPAIRGLNVRRHFLPQQQLFSGRARFTGCQIRLPRTPLTSIPKASETANDYNLFELIPNVYKIKYI